MFSALRMFDAAKKCADDAARSGRGGGGGGAARARVHAHGLELRWLCRAGCRRPLRLAPDTLCLPPAYAPRCRPLTPAPTHAPHDPPAPRAGAKDAAVSDLIGRQAEWSEESADYEAAAEMYIKARWPRGEGGVQRACRCCLNRLLLACCPTQVVPLLPRAPLAHTRMCTQPCCPAGAALRQGGRPAGAPRLVGAPPRPRARPQPRPGRAPARGGGRRARGRGAVRRGKGGASKAGGLWRPC